MEEEEEEEEENEGEQGGVICYRGEESWLSFFQRRVSG